MSAPDYYANPMTAVELKAARAAGVRPQALGANLCGADLCGADLRGADLCGADLRGANLCGADLCGADLRGADLCGADLRGANLRGANLCGADLCGADLRGADLCGADLRGADLRGADLYGILTIHGIPSGFVALTPTSQGWHLRVGCWSGTVDALRTLIASDDGWPEARGDEIARRRPLLSAVADLCDAHMAAHTADLALVVEKWGAVNAERTES